MNNERRLSEREATKLSVKCWVMDKDYNPILIEHIPASCLNISSGGMVLEWPLWWKCKGCSYGEKKHAELSCTLDKCQFENTNQFLIAATLLRVCIEEKKAEHVAKVVWIREKEDCCHLGIAFPG